MNENEVVNKIIFEEVNILDLLKQEGAISQDCETTTEAYEQATGGW